MQVVVNGEERDVVDDATVADLLHAIDAPESGIAVACNEQVVQRAAFGAHRLAQGDRIEIIKAVAGG